MSVCLKEVLYLGVNKKLFTSWKCNCGIAGKKIRGRIVTKHHEALYFWEELIRNGTLTPVFEVVHIDAHADLGLGDSSYVYLMEELMHKSPSERINYDKDKLNEGNYLAFAAALGFLEKLLYISHPKWNNDIPRMHMENFSISSNNIIMKATEKLNIGLSKEPNVVHLDPAIPFKRVDYNSFKDTGDFDFIVLSQSPQYTPKSSDELIPVFERYIEKI